MSDPGDHRDQPPAFDQRLHQLEQGLTGMQQALASFPASFQETINGLAARIDRMNLPSPTDHQASAQARTDGAVHVTAVPHDAPLHRRLPDPIARPPRYDGKNKSYANTWLAQCDNYINEYPDLYKTPVSKVRFVVSQLDGDPATWAHSQVDRVNSPLLKDWSSFKQAFLVAHGRVDTEYNLTNRLWSIRQTGSAADYATAFFVIADQLSEYGTKPLLQLFTRGLKHELQLALAVVPDQPTDIRELADLAIRIDNRLWTARRQQQPQRHHSNRNGNGNRNINGHFSRNTSTSTPNATLSPGTPMELDATGPRRKLTDAEKQHRRDNNLCHYCGDSKHILNNCPHRPKPGKPRTANATMPAPPASTSTAATHPNA